MVSDSGFHAYVFRLYDSLSRKWASMPVYMRTAAWTFRSRFAAGLTVLLASKLDTSACQDKNILSPVSGRINNIAYHLHELIHPKNILAVITPDSPSVSIDTYLSKTHLDHLKLGAKVQVIFPDDIVSHGKITSIESTASQMIELGWEGYDHVPSRILVTAVPANVFEKKVWIRYDRMEVRVRGEK